MCTQVGGVYGRGVNVGGVYSRGVQVGDVYGRRVQVGDVYRLPRTVSKGHRPTVTIMVPSFSRDIHETVVTEVSETE